MKKFKILLFAVIVLFIHSIAYSQSITVTSPNGGENWVIGTTHNITWTSSGITTGTFVVRLFDGTTSIGIIQAGIPCTDGAHSIPWIVGNLAGGGTASSGSNYLVKVRQASLAPKDFSNAPFTISEPGGGPPTGSITVTSPNGGENWATGTLHNISWTASGITHNFKITMWKGSIFKGLVASNISSSSNSYSWAVGFGTGGMFPPSSGYKIKVEELTTGVSDMSNETFTIGPRDDTQMEIGSIRITSPRQGDYLIAGGSWNIEWGYNGNIPEKCCELHLFKGIQHLTKIVDRVCTNSYTWPIPSNLSGSDYKIRLITKDRQIHDDSDTFPIIASQPDLAIYGKMTRIPKHPGMGETFKFRFCVTNNGGGIANASVAELIITGPESYRTTERIAIRKLSGLGDRKYFSKDLKLDKWGIYRFTLKLDVDNNVTEANEGNNEKYILVDVNPLPDLTVTVISGSNARLTFKSRIWADVKNIGEFRSAPSILHFYVQKHGTNTYNIPALDPGETHTITRREKWFKLGYKNYNAYIDKDNHIKEINENNNFAKNRIKVITGTIFD